MNISPAELTRMTFFNSFLFRWQMLLDILSLLLEPRGPLHKYFSSRVLIAVRRAEKMFLELFLRCFMTEKLELHNNYFLPGFFSFGDKKWLSAEMYSMMLVSWSAFLEIGLGQKEICTQCERE